ncbi:MAG: hypothetical protein ACQXXF_02430 [Thermoplasmatota archaeon]|jgi:hypothetical protein
MKKSNFIKDNNVVAGVLEALLLVGLVAIILSFIQLYYVPEIMEDKEATHMDLVCQQFSQLKSVIEIQSIMGIINDENPNPKFITYTSMSSPITLGSRQLPYFVSSASPGQIALIDKNDANESKITIDPPPLPLAYDYPFIPLTSIKYEAFNYYFIPQKYIFEGGGIILNQADGEVMSVNPSMNIINNSNDIEIIYDIPIFIGTPGKKINGGYDLSYIRTNYIRYYEGSQNNVSEISIYTQYPNAWYHCLVNTTRGLLWEYVKNNDIKVELDKSTTPNRIIITPDSKNIFVKITLIEIGVQIGPGAVISK